MLKALRPRLELQTKKVSSSPPGLAPILRDPEISETGGKANRFRALLPRLLCERPIRCFRSLGDEGQADHIDQGKQRDRQGKLPVAATSAPIRVGPAAPSYGGVLVGAHPTQAARWHLLGEWRGPVVRASRKAVCATSRQPLERRPARAVGPEWFTQCCSRNGEHDETPFHSCRHFWACRVRTSQCPTRQSCERDAERFAIADRDARCRTLGRPEGNQPRIHSARAMLGVA